MRYDDLVKSRQTDGFDCRGAMLRARYRARAACPYDARRAKTEECGPRKGRNDEVAAQSRFERD
jgi:hypothetical protein